MAVRLGLADHRADHQHRISSRRDTRALARTVKEDAMKMDSVAPAQEPNPENLNPDLPRQPPASVSEKKDATSASAPSKVAGTTKPPDPEQSLWDPAMEEPDPLRRCRKPPKLLEEWRGGGRRRREWGGTLVGGPFLSAAAGHHHRTPESSSGGAQRRGKRGTVEPGGAGEGAPESPVRERSGPGSKSKMVRQQFGV